MKKKLFIQEKKRNHDHHTIPNEWILNEWLEWHDRESWGTEEEKEQNIWNKQNKQMNELSINMISNLKFFVIYIIFLWLIIISI